LKEGDSYRINIIMHKTQAPIYIPLSKKAVNWIPERKDMSEDARLFPGLPEQVSAPQYLTPWMKAAGINKPITFHSSRHSFATMMLTLDVDLYTVSKLLGHTKVETTQIYAKIINKKKDDAVSLIDAAFDKMQDSTQSKAI
jgi:site-specific recombinase XerD